MRYHSCEWLGSKTPVPIASRALSFSCEGGDLWRLRSSFHRWSPSLIRDSSRRVKPALRFTNQAHCPRNTSSRSPAKTCGRPKRSRVKNPPMQRRRVFYHVPGRFWQFYLERSAMEEPKESSQGRPNRQPEQVEISPLSPPPQLTLTQRLRILFVGPEGLRLVWRFVLYLAM